MNAISPIRSSICLRSRGATKKGLITSTGECGTDSSAAVRKRSVGAIGRGQRHEAKVRLTHRWREMDSNLQYRAVKGRVCSEHKRSSAQQLARYRRQSNGLGFIVALPR